MKKCLLLFPGVFAAGLVCLAVEPPVVSVLENNIRYVCASRATENFLEQCRAIPPTDFSGGTVLDLRFASGDENSMSGAAKFFVGEKSPVMILVNGQTHGPAVTLALQLRAAGAGVLIGSTNAPTNIQPDIAVTVSVNDEKKFLENPCFAAPVPAIFSTTNDLLPFVDHMTEAELVRKKVKDGEDSGIDALLPRAALTQPVIRDPALARAVDLLKALAVLHPTRG